mgnify:CR=1 FL=1
MTNEELAEKIGSGGNNDLLSVLWEQTRLFFSFCSEKYYRNFRNKCDNAGVVSEDLIQECYFAMLDGIKAYTKRPSEQSENVFLTYCRFPMRNRFAEMLGLRGHDDPLNSDKIFLDAAIPNSETEKTTWLDILEDPKAEKPFREFEDRIFNNSVRKYIFKLLQDDNSNDYEVIKRRYFKGQTFKEIAEVFGVSPERARQMEREALARLRECHELQQLVGHSYYKHVGLENFKHNGSIEEQIVEQKEFNSWRNRILEKILQKE